jgi:ketosteroid isomerase-like protein
MKRQSRWLLAAVLVLAAAPLCACRHPDAQGQVREAVRAYFDSLNRADPTDIMERFSHTENTSSILEGDILRGWKAIRDETDWMAGTAGEEVWAPGTMEVVFLGSDHALVVVPVNLTLTLGMGREEVAGAATLVLERKAGVWKVLHEHRSLQHDDYESPEDGTSRS